MVKLCILKQTNADVYNSVLGFFWFQAALIRNWRDIYSVNRIFYCCWQYNAAHFTQLCWSSFFKQNLNSCFYFFMMLGHMKYRSLKPKLDISLFFCIGGEKWRITCTYDKNSNHILHFIVYDCHVTVFDWVFHRYTMTGWGQRFYIPPTIKVYCALYKTTICVIVFNFTGCHVDPQTCFTTIAKASSDRNRKYEESKLE